MKPHGLITDEWLVSYAAGSLSNSHAMIVAAHAHYQPALQEKIHQADALGGALITAADESPLAEGLLADTLSRLEDTLDDDPAADNYAATPGSENTDTDLPDCLRAYLGCNLHDLKWRIMGPGMHQVKLDTGPDGEKLWLLKARGGTIIPEHDHTGTEMTLILRGSYRIGDTQYRPGDMEIADQSVSGHQPLINKGEDCICLVVTGAPIRLKSWIGRMMQPFIGL